MVQACQAIRCAACLQANAVLPRFLRFSSLHLLAFAWLLRSADCVRPSASLVERSTKHHRTDARTKHSIVASGHIVAWRQRIGHTSNQSLAGRRNVSDLLQDGRHETSLREHSRSIEAPERSADASVHGAKVRERGADLIYLDAHDLELRESALRSSLDARHRSLVALLDQETQLKQEIRKTKQDLMQIRAEMASQTDQHGPIFMPLREDATVMANELSVLEQQENKIKAQIAKDEAEIELLKKRIGETEQAKTENDAEISKLEDAKKEASAAAKEGGDSGSGGTSDTGKDSGSTPAAAPAGVDSTPAAAPSGGQTEGNGDTNDTPPATGCFHAKKSDFPNCHKYEECGYVCIGDQCGYEGKMCKCDCRQCAHEKPEHFFDAAKAECTDTDPNR